jgi:5-carboxymethyl-2-hydroxymuconate isomerase
MPHLRIEVAEEWLREDFTKATGFDAKKLLDHLVQVVSSIRMEKPDRAPGSDETVPFINLSNLKHAIVPVYYAHVAGDPSKRFLHVTMSAGNDTPGRTAAVRRHVAQVLGDEVDRFVGPLKGLASVTVHVKDIDRDRGYSTTAERKKKREQTPAAVG